MRIREMGRCLRWAERNFYEVSHSLSRDTDRWPLDFLSRGRSERCPHSPPAAWSAVFFTNVRAALHEAFRSLPPGRSRLPPVSYTHLRAHETPEHLVCRL